MVALILLTGIIIASFFLALLARMAGVFKQDEEISREDRNKRK